MERISLNYYNHQRYFKPGQKGFMAQKYFLQIFPLKPLGYFKKLIINMKEINTIFTNFIHASKYI